LKEKDQRHELKSFDPVVHIPTQFLCFVLFGPIAGENQLEKKTNVMN
jgi:hypothetical protein